MTKASKDISKERKKQDRVWGEQNHDPFVWLAILQEEVGEFSQEALRMTFDCNIGDTPLKCKARMREEAVHVAAVAMAIVECLDRKKWVGK